MIDLHHGQVFVNGLSLHYVEAGEGPLVLLLHGFPDFWYSWRFQLPALAAAGFRAVAPDLRGYNLSDKPVGIHQYRLDRLAQDIVGLIRVLGAQRAALVGHDWGGVIAWKLANVAPEVLTQLVILNAPHPAAFSQALRTFSQLRRSWYLFFFQLPWLPEAVIRTRDYAILRRVLRGDLGADALFTEDDLKAYRAALSQPGALTAALNYYRAASRSFWREPMQVNGRITVPTLVIWGERDPYLDLRLLRNLDRWVCNLRIQRIPDAGHWVHLEAREQVTSLIIEFLTRKNEKGSE
jgi:pimeloyl-ACP methyl ester carboxylesterase